VATFFAILLKILYVHDFAVFNFFRFYVNTCTSQNHDHGSQWWQASDVVLGYSVACLAVGAAFLLVDIDLRWKQRNREKDRQAQTTGVEDVFFACIADHQIEANTAAAKGMGAAVVILQKVGAP